MIGKTQKKGKRSSEVFAKPYAPCPIKLARRYNVLESDSEVERGETTQSANMQQRSGYTMQNGMYKSVYSPCEVDCILSRPNRGGRCRRSRKEEKGRQVVGRERSRSVVYRHQLDQRSLGRQEDRERRLAGKQVVRTHTHTPTTLTGTKHKTHTHTHATLHNTPVTHKNSLDPTIHTHRP